MNDEPTRRVVLACDANLGYVFTLPFTCAVWRRRIGYTPTVFLIGTSAEWLDDPRLALILEAMEPAGPAVFFLGDFSDVTGPDGYKRSTFAQVARLTAAAMPWDEDDYLLTCDAEMWGLDREYFNRPVEAEKFDLYSPDCYAHEPVHHETMNYLGATVAVWREVMGLTACEAASGPPAAGIAEQLIGYLDRELGRGKDEWTQWNFDETGVTAMLERSGYWPDRCRDLGRKPFFWTNNSPGSRPVRRIERLEPWGGKVDGKIDANLPYGGDGEKQRQRILAVFDAAMPYGRPKGGGPRGTNWPAWGRNYVERFLSLQPAEVA